MSPAITAAIKRAWAEMSRAFFSTPRRTYHSTGLFSEAASCRIIRFRSLPVLPHSRYPTQVLVMPDVRTSASVPAPVPIRIAPRPNRHCKRNWRKCDQDAKHLNATNKGGQDALCCPVVCDDENQLYRSPATPQVASVHELSTVVELAMEIGSAARRLVRHARFVDLGVPKNLFS